MQIGEILRYKGSDVVTIGESETVLVAARLLVERNIGSAVVAEGERPTGIVTERDILRLVARDPAVLASTSVGSVMTRDLIIAGPEDQIEEMMIVMTTNKVRHLPIVDDGLLAGIISIGDLVNASRVAAENENSHLREYIQGGG